MDRQQVDHGVESNDRSPTSPGDEGASVEAGPADSGPESVSAQSAREFSLRAPKNRLSAKAVAYWTLSAFSLWVVVAAIQSVFLLLADEPPTWLIVTLIATGVVGLIHIAIMPSWRYRVHRWEITDKAIFVLSGWIKQEWRIAPISRLQTVDIGRGPFEQLFGLAKVTITTASAAGPLHIQALDYQVALRLVDDLTANTQATRGDAT